MTGTVTAKTSKCATAPTITTSFTARIYALSSADASDLAGLSSPRRSPGGWGERLPEPDGPERPLTVVRDSVRAVSDSVSVFAEHAHDYDAQRRRLVPCFDLFYGTAVDALGLREGPIGRVLDLGAGTGLMSEAVLDALPGRRDRAARRRARRCSSTPAERLPESSIATVVADLRDELPEGPFDAVVSALAIHHLEHADKRDLLRRDPRDACAPGGVFVNAEHVAGRTPVARGRLPAAVARGVRGGGRQRGGDRGRGGAHGDGPLGGRRDAAGVDGRRRGSSDCDCFFKHLHFAVLAGWRG